MQYFPQNKAYIAGKVSSQRRFGQDQRGYYEDIYLQDVVGLETSCVKVRVYNLKQAPQKRDQLQQGKWLCVNGKLRRVSQTGVLVSVDASFNTFNGYDLISNAEVSHA